VQVAIITLLATFFTQLGFLLWKVAASGIPPIGKTKTIPLIKALLTNKKWVSGLLSLTVGWALFIYATNIGAISIVQPLMSTGDLFLVLMAIVFLGERLSKKECQGLALTVIGAALLVIEVRPIQPIVIDWVLMGGFFLATALCGLIGVIGLKRTQNQEVMFAIIIGISFGMGAVFTKLMTAFIAQNGAVPATIDFVLNPIFPLVIAANFLGMATLQAAFQKGRASVIVPIQLSVMNCLVVIAGAVLFSEVISVFHFGCIALIAAGTFFMQRASSRT
jgi:uncharacterized membrane protein